MSFKTLYFPGSFDPPHAGHWAMAQQAYQQFLPKSVQFVPAYAPPHKLMQTPWHHRLAMLQRLAESHPSWLKVNPIEATLPAPTYTVKTLEALEPILFAAMDHQIGVIIGADGLAGLAHWKAPEIIIQAVTFIVARRAASPLTLPQIPGCLPVFIELTMPDVPVSSTGIREKLLQGQPVLDELPETVWQYIHQHQLYPCHED